MDLLTNTIDWLIVLFAAIGALFLAGSLIALMIYKGGKPPQKDPLEGLEYHETDNGGKN